MDGANRAVVLSILICALDCRRALLDRLMKGLQTQLDRAAGVEAIIESDNGAVSIGAKRNALLARATGDYVCFIDDDDTVSDDYLPSILDALGQQPDCVGFKSDRYEDGRFVGRCTYSLSVQREREVSIPGECWQFERWPNHLTPVRRELAIAAGFEDWCYGEDRQYAKCLRKAGLTPESREVFIDKVLYHYWLRFEHNRAGEVAHPRRWCDVNSRFTQQHN